MEGPFGGSLPSCGPLATAARRFSYSAPWSTTNPIGGSLCSPGNGVAAVGTSWLSSGCKDGISPDSLFGRAASRTVRGGIFGVNEVFLLPVEIGKHA